MEHNVKIEWRSNHLFLLKFMSSFIHVYSLELNSIEFEIHWLRKHTFDTLIQTKQTWFVNCSSLQRIFFFYSRTFKIPIYWPWTFLNVKDKRDKETFRDNRELAKKFLNLVSFSEIKYECKWGMSCHLYIVFFRMTLPIRNFFFVARFLNWHFLSSLLMMDKTFIGKW